MEEDGRELEVHSYPQILEQWICVIVYSICVIRSQQPCFPWPALTYRYLLVFLKFVQAVIPTIEYDYTHQLSLTST